MDNYLSIKKACENAKEYPKTLQQQSCHSYRLGSLQRLLEERQRMLFSTESKSEVYMWERESFLQPPNEPNTKIVSEEDLRRHLGLIEQVARQDPQIRFVFLTAANSRAPLSITYGMFTTVLTYHQAMAPFVDLLLSFGQQEDAQDFHYTGFFAESPVLTNGPRQQIPELGRSSISLQLCYNLRAPERHEYQPRWPWSLRQASVYHSLDLENGRATWVLVKANSLLRRRITQSRNTTMGAEPKSNETTAIGVSLSASFVTHLILCHWAVEEWRWYINYLETQLQEYSRNALYVMADGDPNVSAETSELDTTPKPGLLKRISTFTTIFQPPDNSKMSPHASSAPGRIEDPTNKSNGLSFAFSRLQETQNIGDKANEALLVLRANREVLCGLRCHYRALMDGAVKSMDTAECERHVSLFERRIMELERVLRMEQARVEALLKLVEDRKNLLYGLLNHLNTTASKVSTQNMEAVTNDMHVIAQKTQQETVSMRIITLITLIFLPGTFVSTIMSTDIVSWGMDNDKPQKTVYVGALNFFMILTVPLILLTFAVWAGFYWSEKRKQEREKNRSDRSLEV